MLFGHSMLGLFTTLADGSEHIFRSFYARAFDHFGGRIGACFLIILCHGFSSLWRVDPSIIF